jgi:transposase
MVNGLGLVVSCYISAANLADVKAAPAILVPALENNARLVKVLADQSYRGDIAQWLQQAYGCVLELTQKLRQGFVVEPWRWVVERPFVWLENVRRLCRDYEELPEHHESFIFVTMIRLSLCKLTYNQGTRHAVPGV